MDELIDANIKNDTIALGKSEEFISCTKKVSDYIKDMPMSVEQNDALIKMLIEHLDIGRKDAFKQGFLMGWREASLQ